MKTFFINNFVVDHCRFIIHSEIFGYNKKCVLSGCRDGRSYFWTCRCKLLVHVRLPISSCTTSSEFEARLRKCGVMWHQWTIAAETATSAILGGTCNYAAAAPRHLHITPVFISLHWLPVPWRITFQNTGFDLPSNA